MIRIRFSNRFQKIAAACLLAFCLGSTAAFCLNDDFMKRNNLTAGMVPTESGDYFMVYVNGLRDGTNNEKIFGKGKPTTLWADDRRTECFALALRMIAQMPAAQGGAGSREDILHAIRSGDGWVSNLDDVVEILKLFDSRSFKPSKHKGLCDFLKRTVPKSHGGLVTKWFNLRMLGKGIKGLSYLAKITDLALAASIQQALAGDLSLARLDRLRGIISTRQLVPLSRSQRVDPTLDEAFPYAEGALHRSEEYWGALLTELHERRAELGVLTAEALIAAAHDAVFKKYGLKLAAKFGTKASIACFALCVTIETIMDILDQHRQAQIGVAAATIAYILDQEIRAGRLSSDDNLVLAMQAQAEAVFCHQMVTLATGWQQNIHDFLSPGHDYKDVRIAYAKLQAEAEARARLHLLGADSGVLTDVTVDSISIVLTVWDHQVIDGDQIDLVLGNRVLLQDHVLGPPPGRSVSVTLGPGDNIVKLHADNTGRLYPNTATLKISNVVDGRSEQVWSVGLNRNATLRVVAPYPSDGFPVR